MLGSLLFCKGHAEQIPIFHCVETPVWYTLSWICCIEGPYEICTQSAEVRLVVSGGQPLLTLGLPIFALSLAEFLSLLWSPSTSIKSVYFVKNITHTKPSKIHVGLKFEWGLQDTYWLSWELLPFEVFFSCLCDVLLLRVTYVNMLATTEACTSPHLTCMGLCDMEVWKFIGANCAMYCIPFH